MINRQSSPIAWATAFAIAVASLCACGSNNSTGPRPGVTVSPPVTSVGTNPVPMNTLPAAGSTTGTNTNPLPGAAGASAPAVVPTVPGPATTMGTGGAAAPLMMGAAGAAAAPAPGTSPLSLYDPATKTLMAPAPGEGVQISTPMFEVPPGAEKFACYHTEIPVDGPINVHYYESVMAAGSHHFILYKTDNDATPVGTMDQNGCITGFQSWIYSSAQPHIDLQIPEGVAFALGSRQRIAFDMHYINTTQQTLQAHVTLNVIFAQGEFQQAAPLISYNTGIFIPPNGTQTVEGDCTPGPGAKFFYMLTHEHRRGTMATISRLMADGSMGETLVSSPDWEVPMERKWITEPFMTFQPGEKLHYRCDYQNDLPQVVTTGPSADTNEMCMAITYYFPASAGGSCN